MLTNLLRFMKEHGHLWKTSNPCFTKFWYLHTKGVFYANFALKRAVTDNSDKFDQKAGKTLLRNFYVDDLLKSTKGAEEAVSMFKNVVQMCAAGGFKLTKFISNHPDVLSAMLE